VAQFEKSRRAETGFRPRRAPNLGGALAKLGRLDEALVQLRQALGVGRRVCARALPPGSGTEPAGGRAGRYSRMAQRD